jgi:hypothetical protein
MAWLTAADRTTVETLWPDADGILDDPVLNLYLDAAREACEAFAPALAEGQEMPASWQLAQVMQARNVWNAGNASAGGDFDGSSYGLSTHPLDWQVKQLLRPRRVLGAIW